MSRNGQRLNEPMRDYSDDPRVPPMRNDRRYDLTAFAQEATRRLRPLPSDRQRVEQMRADPARQFEDMGTVRKLPRGVLP